MQQSPSFCIQELDFLNTQETLHLSLPKVSFHLISFHTSFIKVQVNYIRNILVIYYEAMLTVMTTVFLSKCQQTIPLIIYKFCKKEKCSYSNFTNEKMRFRGEHDLFLVQALCYHCFFYFELMPTDTNISINKEQKRIVCDTEIGVIVHTCYCSYQRNQQPP